MDESEDLRADPLPRLPVKSSLWRVFCAIDIPEEARTRLVDHIRLLRTAVPNANTSWSRPANIHLTLKFFGDVQAQDTERLSLAAAEAVRGVSPFPIGIAGNGVFPKHGVPSVLWLGIDDATGNLSELQRRLEDECDREGFAKEERAFRPHLTLARLRRPTDARALADTHKQMGFAETKFSVSELMLIRSELRSEGSKYTVISRHALQPKALQNRER